MTLQPERNADGDVTGVNVIERIDDGIPMEGRRLSLHATLMATTNRDGSNKIAQLHVTDPSGDIPLDVSDDAASGYRRWVAQRSVTVPIRITYFASVEDLHQNAGPPYGLKAIQGGLSGAGIAFLLLPENGTTTATSLHWDLSRLEAGSIGVVTVGEGDQTIPGSPEKLGPQWYLAGPARQFRDAASNFYAYGLGTPAFDLGVMFRWSDRAYTQLARKFGRTPAPKFVLNVRALPFKAFTTGTAFPGGALVHTGDAFELNQDIDYLHGTLFHEMTHEFVGEIDGRSNWFSEGFTVYTTAVIPFRYGLSSPDVYQNSTDGINGIARNYYTDKARSWSLERIRAAEKTDEEVREVPYNRSALYFANLDAQIEAHSGGKRDIFSFVLPQLSARAQGKPFNVETWEGELRRELGPTAVEEFRNEVLEGRTLIKPFRGAFCACFSPVPVHWPATNGRGAADGYMWTRTEKPIALCINGRK